MTRALVFFALIALSSACVSPLQPKDSGRRSSLAKSNDPASLSSGHGRYLTANPTVLSGGKDLPPDTPLSLYLSSRQQFITNAPTLKESCLSPDATIAISDCFSTFQDNNTPPLTPPDGTWGFHPDTLQFLEPHTFAHIKLATNRFHDDLAWSFRQVNPPLGPGHNTAISSRLYSNGGFWYGQSLISYSACEQVSNAFFRPSSFSLCFGIDPEFSGLVFSEDPSVIYHEHGHAITHVLINSRSRASSLDPSKRAQMGVLFYDEAGAINEGIADYWSFVQNRRKHMGEWALGAFFQADRPLTESDPIHAPGISLAENERLRYPTYLNYNPQAPQTPIEDIHQAGMIASHYFVALTEEFQNFCGVSENQAIQFVNFVLIETLSELGDLTSKGSDVLPYGANDNVNLVENNLLGENPSKLWTEVVYPMNYRRFFQTWAKYMLQIFGRNSLCRGNPYPKDRIEKLLDNYGLLLFRSYNENGNGSNLGAPTGHAGIPTQVNPGNRFYSLLLNKDKLKLDPRDKATLGFVFDQPSDMQKLVSSLITSGQATDFSSLIPSQVPFNNGNGKISPGEIIGLSLNMYNDSNTTMAGVHILANDWDHIKRGPDGKWRPCPINDFPAVSAGGAMADSSPPVPGDCQYITKTNGGERNPAGETVESLAPVCLALMQDANETKWVLQSEYARFVGLEGAQCLKGASKPNECFLRAVPGADHATFSKIDANKTWGETQFNNGQTPFQTSNLLLFEVNPFTPPGSSFLCRFRARFSNCDDCYRDIFTGDNNDDYLDFEYAGARPYRVIDFQFQVLD